MAEIFCFPEAIDTKKEDKKGEKYKKETFLTVIVHLWAHGVGMMPWPRCGSVSCVVKGPKGPL